MTDAERQEKINQFFALANELGMDTVDDDETANGILVYTYIDPTGTDEEN